MLNLQVPAIGMTSHYYIFKHPRLYTTLILKSYISLKKSILISITKSQTQLEGVNIMQSLKNWLKMH